MSGKLHKAVLLLGSNLGDRLSNLENALKGLILWSDDEPVLSSIYSSASWGDKSLPDYLNQVLILYTWLDSEELLFRSLEIEKKMGRERTVKYASRTIDIDILFFENDIIDEDNLIIPHPRLHERKFALVPLAELMPDYIHPILGVSIASLLASCDDKSDVSKLEFC